MKRTVLEVIVYVEDMASMVSFYHEVLGLAFKDGTGPENPADAYWVPFDAGALVLALHGGGKKEEVSGAPKVVFSSRNLDIERAHFQEMGIKVSDIRSPAPGIEVFDAWDPEGNVFSLESYE